MLLKAAECSPEVINFLANKACQCYVALSDWPSVKEWQAAVHGLKQSSGGPLGVTLRTDLNYIQALSCFDDGDLAECVAQLELLPGEDHSSLANSKDKLGASPHAGPPARLRLLSLVQIRSELCVCFRPEETAALHEPRPQRAAESHRGAAAAQRRQRHEQGRPAAGAPEHGPPRVSSCTSRSCQTRLDLRLRSSSEMYKVLE